MGGSDAMGGRVRRTSEDSPIIAYVEDAESAPLPGTRMAVAHVSRQGGAEVVVTAHEPNPDGAWRVTRVVPLGADGRRVRVYLEVLKRPDTA